MLDRGFVYILPSVNDASGLNQSPRIVQNHSAKFGGQLSVQPERRRNRGGHDKDSTPARDAFHHHLDEGEMRPEWLLLLTTTAQEYGPSHHGKARHEPRRVDNTHRKTMDRAPRPGSADRLPDRNSPSRRQRMPPETYDWRANSDRKRRDHRSASAQSLISQQLRFWREAAERLFAQSCSGW